MFFGICVIIKNNSVVTIKIKGQGDVEFNETIINGPTEGAIQYVTTGKKIELVAKPADGWTFSHYEDEDGNILSDEEILVYKINGDMTIVAVFVNRVAHTLYISSMTGGDAWLNDRLVDTNGDGKVTLEDVNNLAKYLAGWTNVTVN